MRLGRRLRGSPLQAPAALHAPPRGLSCGKDVARSRASGGPRKSKCPHLDILTVSKSGACRSWKPWSGGGQHSEGHGSGDPAAHRQPLHFAHFMHPQTGSVLRTLRQENQKQACSFRVACTRGQKISGLPGCRRCRRISEKKSPPFCPSSTHRDRRESSAHIFFAKVWGDRQKGKASKSGGLNSRDPPRTANPREPQKPLTPGRLLIFAHSRWDHQHAFCKQKRGKTRTDKTPKNSHGQDSHRRTDGKCGKKKRQRTRCRTPKGNTGRRAAGNRCHPPQGGHRQTLRNAQIAQPRTAPIICTPRQDKRSPSFRIPALNTRKARANIAAAGLWRWELSKWGRNWRPRAARTRAECRAGS